MQVSLKEVGAGRFQLRWSIYIDGQRRCRKRTITGSKRQAQLERTQLQRKIDTREYVDASPLTVAELMERWLTDSVRGTVANQTWRNYEMKVRAYIVPRLGTLRLDQMTGMRLDRFYRDLLMEGRVRGRGGLGAESTHQIHRVLKQALDQAVRWRLIPRNPCQDATPPRVPKTVEKEYQILTETQLEDLIHFLEGTPFHLPVPIAGRTGMRRQEVLGLKWDCVNLDEGTILVCRALDWTRAEGLQVKDTKTRCSRRTLAIPADLVRALSVEKERQVALRIQLGNTFNPECFVCIDPQGIQWMPDRFSSRFAEVMKRQGQVPVVSFHELRHSHASHMIWAGVPMKVISNRLGHASIVITMDRYGHLREDVQDREAVTALDVRCARMLEERR